MVQCRFGLWLASAGLAFLVGLPGCSMAPVHVAQLQVAPTTPMVANKSDQPLRIVLDPAKVPDSYVIPKGETKKVDVFELQTFVSRDLKKAMEAFFTTVEVVPPSAPPPTGPYWVGDVRIDELSILVDKATAGSVTAYQAHGRIKWAFALRPSTANDYAFSFAGETVSDAAMTTVNDTVTIFQNAFELAISSMVKSLVDKGVDKLILAEPGDAPSEEDDTADEDEAD